MEKLNTKLALLHACLVMENIPQTLPQELGEYQEAFEQFKQTVQGCSSSIEKKYLEALSVLRDVLLENKK